MDIYGNPSGDVTSSSAVSVNNDIAVFDGVSGRIIKDSGVPISGIVGPTGATGARGATGPTLSGGPFLPLSGVTGMLGNIMMNSNGITGISTITTATANVNVGNGNTVLANNSIIVGATNNLVAGAGDKSIIYGHNNNTSAGINGQAIIFGNDNTDSNGAGGVFMYGFGNTNGTGQRNILIGRNNTVPNGINEAFVMGFNNTNSTSNSLMVGGVSQINIRAGSTICDLGTTSNNFKDLYLSGRVLLPAATSNVNIGNGNTNTGTNIVQIGDTNTQSLGNNSISIGSNIINRFSNGVAIGSFSQVDGGSAGIAIGPAAFTNAANAIAIGNSSTNLVASSAVIGDAVFTSLRPMPDNFADLGSGAQRWKDIYLTGTAKAISVDPNSASALTIGGTNATSLALGRSAIDTTILGNAVATVAYGSWYSTTNYTPTFNAGVNRLLPQTTTSAGFLSQFTHTNPGVLTYTGTRNRICKIDFDITVTLGASLANLTFFDSQNGSTLIGSQTQISYQVHPSNNATQVSLHFSDLILIQPGYTHQLAGRCAQLSSATTFNFVSCTIVGLLN